MGEVVARLGIEAEQVVFGHIHRAGPFPDDPAEWVARTGARLVNTGCWVHEPFLLDGARIRRTLLRPGAPSRSATSGGAPRVVSLLDDVPPA